MACETATRFFVSVLTEAVFGSGERGRVAVGARGRSDEQRKLPGR